MNRILEISAASYQLVIENEDAAEILEIQQPGEIQILEIAAQGPAGIQGDGGSAGSKGDKGDPGQGLGNGSILDGGNF